MRSLKHSFLDQLDKEIDGKLYAYLWNYSIVDDMIQNSISRKLPLMNIELQIRSCIERSVHR